ncbi:hypothetical protein [Pseudomonas abietaniphila]|uniref:hypothetical protein n=1 Tax=Pseudomonas abietaniphila TaxID=89065 RepID=UPI00128E24BF|nr:hypothetical protein [Pseudomonas abietaniphila]
MSHIKAKVKALSELVDAPDGANTIFERSALFSAVQHLVNDLSAHEDLNGYAKEKAETVRWHVGAALGFDQTNGHDSRQHRVWALGEVQTLESCYE